jgi:hypothetical protein
MALRLAFGFAGFQASGFRDQEKPPGRSGFAEGDFDGGVDRYS